MKEKNIIRKVLSNTSILLFLKCISRIIKKDKGYIDFAVNGYQDPKCLRVQTLGEKNNGKIIYDIHEQGAGYGFFAEFRALLCNLIFAEEMGFVPNVSWGENHLYHEKYEINGTSNVFEYYFEPVRIPNVCESRNVIISSALQNAYIEHQYGVNGYETSVRFEKALLEVMNKYIRIKNDILTEFDNGIEKIFNGNRVIGVHYRGTDYKQEYNGHPVPVDVDKEIQKVREIQKKYDIETVFLATDDANVLKIYKDAFGENLIYYRDIYRGENLKSVAFSECEREFHHYLLGKEVLRDAYTLSRCNCLVAGKSQVSYFAQIFNKCNNQLFESCTIIDWGLNNNNKYFKRNKSN